MIVSVYFGGVASGSCDLSIVSGHCTTRKNKIIVYYYEQEQKRDRES